ncbi:hypothetical protein SEA_TOMAS_236 [Streptomyces phage Tomas]|uniref:Uncharacterized protein n=1 Tax=Streptomyces phage Tomas TaxID=2914443 RepID=A0AA49H078_9CAUD|nr:hypothetical protein PP453_gp087 [Streptomyces phage Tomas]UMO76380.1 hypothetical protein SEA_TOMAS_236 [Streptomyces phage Tomas]
MGDVETARTLFRQFKFEPGTGFICDFVHYPDTAEGVTNVALRVYSSHFDHLPEGTRFLLTEQISSLIKDIRASGVNCILEVESAPRISGRPAAR